MLLWFNVFFCCSTSRGHWGKTGKPTLVVSCFYKTKVETRRTREPAPTGEQHSTKFCSGTQTGGGVDEERGGRGATSEVAAPPSCLTPGRTHDGAEGRRPVISNHRTSVHPSVRPSREPAPDHRDHRGHRGHRDHSNAPPSRLRLQQLKSLLVSSRLVSPSLVWSRLGATTRKFVLLPGS